MESGKRKNCKKNRRRSYIVAFQLYLTPFSRTIDNVGLPGSDKNGLMTTLRHCLIFAVWSKPHSDCKSDHADSSAICFCSASESAMEASCNEK